MEYLEGEDLRARLQKGPLAVEELTALSVQIADALDAAHARGIVHRDIKPANIFLTTRGQVKIMDFGLAKLAYMATPADTDASQAPTAAMEQQLTSRGTTIGTVAYLSPEQARGEDLDARTDLFSFGVVLYEMVTGRSPFLGTTTALTFVSILQNTPVSPPQARPGVPAELERIIAKALAKDRTARYQTAAAMRADLNRLRRVAAAPLCRRRKRPPRVPPPCRFRLAVCGAAGVSQSRSRVRSLTAGSLVHGFDPNGGFVAR
jgi:eukaryotic-like serine/threonine-protein kinase